ncbi:hypothetical protein ACLB2K_016176 [Fragaria x ananassa]
MLLWQGISEPPSFKPHPLASNYPKTQVQTGMAVPRVNKKLLQELESMGFPTARATRALHCSGNASLEASIDWIIDHENDPEIDQITLVTADIDIESPEPFHITEAMKIKAQELRHLSVYVLFHFIVILLHLFGDQTCKKRKEEEKKLEREREKERIRSGKEVVEAKQILEDNERKRNIASRNSEKEEEKRARERIRWKLEQDKLERRVKLGLPPGHTASAKLSIPVMGQIQKSLPVRSVANSEHMRECLRSLRRNHKDDDARVRRAFQTLMTYVGNVAKNPDQGKFRKIRLSNPSFLDRVGSLIGGMEFLELCGFERTEAGEFLYLPRDKVDMATLYSAASELKSALTNPFFGLL